MMGLERGLVEYKLVKSRDGGRKILDILKVYEWFEDIKIFRSIRFELYML